MANRTIKELQEFQKRLYEQTPSEGDTVEFWLGGNRINRKKGKVVEVLSPKSVLIEYEYFDGDELKTARIERDNDNIKIIKKG